MSIISCQLNDSYFPIMDGVGMTAHNYAFWLNTKYGKAHLVTPSSNGYTDQVDYEVIRFRSMAFPGLDPYRAGLPFIDFDFQKKLTSYQFDILHAHCPFVSGRIATRLARRKKIPLVTTFHSKYRLDFERVFGNKTLVNFLMKIMLDFYSKVDHIWVPNQSTGNVLREYGFKGNYEIMPNGTDIKIPAKPEYLKYREEGMRAMGVREQDFVLLFVGQHRWEKNVRMIIDSLRILKSNGVSFKMIFVGEGYASQDMKNLINKFELIQNVQFTGVITDRNKLKSIYACSDLFVFPSVYDTAAIVIIEAAAFGIPSIVIKNSSAAEIIRDDENGFLIENTADNLAKKIIELNLNQEMIKKAGESARKTIYRNWEIIVDEVFIRYQKIIENYKVKKKVEVK